MAETQLQLLRPAFPSAIWSRMLAFMSPDASAPPRFVATSLCGVFAALALIADHADATALKWLLVLLAYGFGSIRASYGALSALREGKPDINFLMVFAALVSALLGRWGEGATLLLLYSLSDALERYAIERTRRGISALVSLRPDTATVLREDREFIVPIEQLIVGDEIRIRPGERIAMDGVVVDGTSSVDESIVTGEPLPVDKQPGSEIFAGTINSSGSLRVRVTRPAAESTISRIVRMVEEAQERKAPIQRVIEKWQTPYVVGVLAISALTILVGMTYLPVAVAIYRGMVLLVSASPCAVVLASPVAVLAAVTRGARDGVLFKGGSHIERLAAADVFAFDKTGTLTRGRPAVQTIEPFAGTDENELLAAAAAIERLSEHPLGAAVVRAAQQRNLALPAVDTFVSEAGVGVHARVGPRWIGIGRHMLFEKFNITLPPNITKLIERPDGFTAIVVLAADGFGGVITFSDQVRREARTVVDQLRADGVRRMIMLTGDHAGPAQRVADMLGIGEVRAGLKPGDKLIEIQRLVRENQNVAMIGDGVNDAPALAAATVGIAMGGAGSDVALETADVVLMRDDLRGLPEALELARDCRAVIRQSMLFAFGMIGMLVVLTLAGAMILPAAVIGHEGSTVLVVLNGLRLLRKRAPVE